jgi:hypothetical protein
MGFPEARRSITLSLVATITAPYPHKTYRVKQVPSNNAVNVA